MAKALNPLIDKAVQTYAVGTPSPNVRNRARVMAIQALEKYDPSRQKLENYLYYQLQGLRRLSAKDQEIISIPERVRLDAYKLDAIENELKDELGRQPTADELANRSGMSLKRITHINKARYGQQSEGYYLSELEGDEDSPLAPEVEQQESYDNLIKFLYDDLDPVNKQILAYSTGMFGEQKLSNSQIAKKLGVSPGAITQRMNRIFGMIQQLQQAELGI
jgi:RNA polymerase sigma factor (sigma-70 family)